MLASPGARAASYGSPGWAGPVTLLHRRAWKTSPWTVSSGSFRAKHCPSFAAGWAAHHSAATGSTGTNPVPACPRETACAEQQVDAPRITPSSSCSSSRNVAAPRGTARAPRVMPAAEPPLRVAFHVGGQRSPSAGRLGLASVVPALIDLAQRFAQQRTWIGRGGGGHRSGNRSGHGRGGRRGLRRDLLPAISPSMVWRRMSWSYSAMVLRSYAS